MISLTAGLDVDYAKKQPAGKAMTPKSRPIVEDIQSATRALAIFCAGPKCQAVSVAIRSAYRPKQASRAVELALAALTTVKRLFIDAPDLGREVGLEF